MRGNDYPIKRIISFLVACLFILLLLPAAGVADNEGISAEKTRKSYLDQFSDDGKQIILTAVSKMSQAEINRLLENLEKTISAEGLEDYKIWLTDNGIAVPTESTETNEPEDVYAAISKMSDAEKQAYIEWVNNMSAEEITEYLRTMNYGLEPEQMTDLNGWLAENGFHNPNLTEESGSPLASASGSEEGGGTLSLSDFAKMNEEEQQAFLIKLTDMSPEDLNAVMCQSAEGLTEEQKETLIGWVVMTNDLSNLDLDNWFSRTTASESGEAGEGTEINGERIDDIDLTQGIPVENMTPTPPPDESVEGTKMDEDQVITGEFTLSPEEEQALLQQATGPTQEELSDEFDESRLSELGEADEGTEIYGERIDDIDLTQGIPVENMTPTPPPDKSAEGTQIDGDQAVTVEISLSTEEEQELLGQATGPTPEELNDTVDESDLFGMGDEKAVTGISQASEENKTKLLDQISKLTAEEFNAFIEALRGKLSEEQMNDFIDWLAAVYGLDTSCPAFSITFPTSFKVYSDWPWPDDLPMPGQGRIWGYAEGGEAVRFEITHITQPTYDQWISNTIAGGAWKEDAKNGKKEIENASKNSFGPRAQTPEEYYTDKGLEMAAVTYFSSVAGTGCVAVAFGANNALIIATRD